MPFKEICRCCWENRYTGIQVYRYTVVQVYSYTGIQVYSCTGIQLHRYTGIESLTSRTLHILQLGTIYLYLGEVVGQSVHQVLYCFAVSMNIDLILVDVCYGNRHGVSAKKDRESQSTALTLTISTGLRLLKLSVRLLDWSYPASLSSHACQPN